MGKIGTKRGCLGSTAGLWKHSQNWNVLIMGWLDRTMSVENSKPMTRTLSSLSCLLPENPISLSNPIPYQDGAIKRRGTEGLSLFKYGYEILKVPQIQQTKSYFLFHRSAKKGKSLCNINKELKIPQQFLKIFFPATVSALTWPKFPINFKGTSWENCK